MARWQRIWMTKKERHIEKKKQSHQIARNQRKIIYDQTVVGGKIIYKYSQLLTIYSLIYYSIVNLANKNIERCIWNRPASCNTVPHLYNQNQTQWHFCIISPYANYTWRFNVICMLKVAPHDSRYSSTVTRKKSLGLRWKISNVRREL